ncbi:MAG TPA: HAMP domain-containing sensor histidine kinase [Sulfurovum sp.]
MKLKNKLYLTQFFIIITLAVFLWVVYTNFKTHSLKDLEKEITQAINVNKVLLKSALQDTYNTFEQQKDLITHIHQTAINEFKKDKSISLIQLKNKIRSDLHLQYHDIDFYLINKDYVITDATFQKDIGLDFNKIPPGKRDLDKASKDNQIHIGKNVSIDYMDSTFKIYSVSKVDDDTYLEMALIDLIAYNNLCDRINDITKHTQNKINLFRVNETTANEEYYEDILNTRFISNKKEWNDALKKFPLESETDNHIILAKRQNTILKDNEGFKEKLVNIYIPLLGKENGPSLGYNDFVMKLTINISEYVTQWQENEKIFITVAFVLILLMSLLYFFIKYSFYVPVTTIIQKLENEEMINDPILINKKDEFGILTDKYNALYTKLQEQIENNKLLLNENKQFIADLVHQIRTPLSVIMTNSSLIEMKTDQQVSSYTQQINSAINMLSNSYEDLAYIITHDTIQYKPKEIDLTRFLHERIDFFEVIANANGKTISTDIADDLKIVMNDTELERIIDNNLSNAIKHSNDKSEIKIILEKINSDIILQFISSGENIKNVDRLFDKNYSEVNTAKRSLGLGLHMVKNICDKNKIFYSVRSEEHTNVFTYIFKVDF